MADRYHTEAEVLAFLSMKAAIARAETMTSKEAPMHEALNEPTCVTSTCPACWTPMPMDDDGRILPHPGRDGAPCDGAGKPAMAVPTHA